MAREILIKRLTKTEAQAQQGSAISAGSYNSQPPVAINNLIDEGGENAHGAMAVDLWLTLNSSYLPSSAAYAEIWAEKSIDGVTYSAKGFVLDIAVSNAETLYRLGMMYDLAPYTKLYIKAIDYAFDAKLELLPVLPELQ